MLRNQGMRQRYVYEMAGHNYRLTDLQAALAIPQLDQLDQTVAQAPGQRASSSSTASRDVAGLRLPQQKPGRGHVWHQFTVPVTDEAPIDRDEFVTLAHRAWCRLRHLLSAASVRLRLLPRHPQVKASRGARRRFGDHARGVTSGAPRAQRRRPRNRRGNRPRPDEGVIVSTPFRIALVGAGSMGSLHAR